MPKIAKFYSEGSQPGTLRELVCWRRKFVSAHYDGANTVLKFSMKNGTAGVGLCMTRMRHKHKLVIGKRIRWAVISGKTALNTEASRLNIFISVATEMPNLLPDGDNKYE